MGLADIPIALQGKDILENQPLSLLHQDDTMTFVPRKTEEKNKQ